MSYFSSLVSEALIERPLTLGNQTVTTYWRALTAGQRLTLLKGQIIKTSGEGGVMEVNLAESAERNQKLVQLTLCDAEGQPVYKTLAALQAEPSRLVEALVRIANDVARDDEGNA